MTSLLNNRSQEKKLDCSLANKHKSVHLCDAIQSMNMWLCSLKQEPPGERTEGAGWHWGH